MKHIILGLAFSSALLFMGCESEFSEDDYTQTYKAGSDDFDFLLTAAYPSGTVNFDQDSVKFEAIMNEEATWVITITGSVSGAEKVLSGTSASIDTADVFWDGSSDNQQFFKTGETVNIQFTAFGSDIVRESNNLVVGNTKKFSGTLITGFETTIGDGFFIDQDYFEFFDGDVPATEGTRERLAWGVYPHDLTWETEEKALPLPVEGDSYFYISGQDFADQPNDFFIGGFGHDPQRYGITKNLDEVFLNFYANTNGNTTTRLKAEVEGIGGDLFIKEIDVDWTGWKLVSIRFSEFVLTESGPLGIGTLLPEAIDKVAFQIMSGGGEAGNAAEACIDYVVITEDKPFSQLD